MLQDTVVEEIMSIVGDREILPPDLHKFKYLERVLKESMRLFPPIPFFARHLEEDIDIGTVLSFR